VLALCFLVATACSLPEKTFCEISSDCLEGERCLVGVCRPTIHGAPASFDKVVTGNGYTCALGSDSAVYCWGANDFGNLGNGTYKPSTIPKPVDASADWLAVDANNFTTCGIRKDNSLWCWGLGTDGQLGDGLLTTEPRPVPVISDKP